MLDEELARLPDRLRAPLLCLLLRRADAGRGGRAPRVEGANGEGPRRPRPAPVAIALARRGVDLSAALAAAAVARDGLSVPPAPVLLALTKVAPGYAVRGPAADTISVTAQALAREGLRMTRRKLTPLLLTTGAVLLVAAGAGYVVGQGPKPPPPSGPVAAAPAARRSRPGRTSPATRCPQGPSPGWGPFGTGCRGTIPCACSSRTATGF